MSLLKWTGHPLADVGVATLCAMVKKSDPQELTLEDLDECGEEMAGCYLHPIFMSYLTCVFPNAPYVNATTGAAKRKDSIQRLLKPHRGEPDENAEGLRCAFSGEPATHLLERSQIPMLTGSGILNFFPSGQSELAVFAPYLLAIQSLPLGGRRCEGKLMLVHCDDNQWTLEFAFRYLVRNRYLINLAKSNRLPEADGFHELLERECAGWDKKKGPKYPDAKAPTTLVLDDLIEVIVERDSKSHSSAHTSVTVYLMSNSGQGPSLAIEQIPGQFVSFLSELQGPEFSSAWKRIVARAWWTSKVSVEAPDSSEDKPTKAKRKKSTNTLPPQAGRSRNEAFNDLLAIYSGGFCDLNAATRFVRRHLLCNPNRYFLAANQSLHSAPKLERESIELINWKLTSLFLERLIGMNRERIELVRSFSDQLADLISTHNDEKLFKGLVFARREYEFREVLARAQRQYAKDQNRLVLTLDQYVNLFTADDGEQRYQWSLLRDLISIRLVEQLLQKQFFDRNKTALNEPQEDEKQSA